MFKFLKTKLGLVGSAIATAKLTAGLIVTATGVVIEATDLAKITDANAAYLNSAFQVVELLPFIAVLSWGFYVLNKVFSIIPKVSG